MLVEMAMKLEVIKTFKIDWIFRSFVFFINLQFPVESPARIANLFNPNCRKYIMLNNCACDTINKDYIGNPNIFLLVMTHNVFMELTFFQIMERKSVIKPEIL